MVYLKEGKGEKGKGVKWENWVRECVKRGKRVFVRGGRCERYSSGGSGGIGR